MRVQLGQEESKLELDSFLRDVKGVENIQKTLHDQTPIVKNRRWNLRFPVCIIGVRRKDCSKLSTRLVGVVGHDYKKRFCEIISRRAS